MTAQSPQFDASPPQALPSHGRLPQEPPVRSIYECSYLEALRHKWIASEQAGKDLGETAITQWLADHWKGWCRERWLEHITGKVCWAEFDRNEWAALKTDFRFGSPTIPLPPYCLMILRASASFTNRILDSTLSVGCQPHRQHRKKSS